MKTLREYISEAEDKKTAIGHFNISNLEGFWAVVNAVKILSASQPMPVIIGVSEGERDFAGIKQVKALVDTVKSEGLPVFLNADHTYSIERIKEVVDAGFDSVIIDEADKNFDENMKVTKEAVAYVRNSGGAVLVEAELGFIGRSSKVLEEIPQGINMTDPAEAEQFVRETEIDLFAPAVGNMHGMLQSGINPKLDIQRIRAIKEAVQIPLVLHGGSGISDDDMRAAIETGISIIHVNTELRVAYKQGLKKSLAEDPEEIAPYKYLKEPLREMQAVVEKKMRLFAGN